MHASPDPEWRKFQHDVADLFRVSGYLVTEGILVGHKRVDILLTESRLGKESRIVVECKRWKGELKQSNVSTIYANYLPLIPAHADEILIITSVPISDTAKRMIADTPHLRAVTYSEIHNSIMDFRPYLQGMVDQYREDGLHHYYVEPSHTAGEDLESDVIDWLSAKSTVPLALLGGYGIGKSTFARRLAHDLAIKAQLDPKARIPILIRLGEISTEQSIEGLLGKAFTATRLVKNYTFEGFMSLNRLGRFVCIFDGFDEMKQSLTWLAFKYNFAQINRLVVNESKVLLLGRPTAFLNDAEHNMALHGITQRGATVLRDPNWPDYREIELVGFTEPQIQKFLHQYLGFLARAAKTERERERYHALSETIIDLSGSNLADIVRRPVQLKMLAELLPDYHHIKLDALTVNGLYDYFIDFVIEREATKPERGRFKPHQLRAFARDIATWLWRKRGQSAAVQAIPQSLTANYLQPGDDPDVAIRDLIVSSLLDRRPGVPFFFPHRSFQEYLVAEEISLSIVERRLDLAELVTLLTPQVVEFLRGFVDEKFRQAAAAGLERFRGPLPLSYVRLLIAGGDQAAHFTSGSPWLLLLTALGIKYDLLESRSFLARVREIQNTTRDPRMYLFTILASLIAATGWKNPLADDPSKLVGETLLGAIGYLNGVYGRKNALAATERSGYFPGELFEFMVGIVGPGDQTGKPLQMTAGYRALSHAAKDIAHVNEWVEGHRDAGLPDKIADAGDRVRRSFDQLKELRRRLQSPKRYPPGTVGRQR